MATLRRDVLTSASPSQVWDAIRDIGALHTRLVPGFVLDTQVEGRVRTVTFANGMIIREPIVSCEDDVMRLVWTAEGGSLLHYNGSAQVFDRGKVTCVTWTADFLPDDAEADIAALMDAGAKAMAVALDCLAEKSVVG